jgi:hypothetical protein
LKTNRLQFISIKFFILILFLCFIPIVFTCFNAVSDAYSKDFTIRFTIIIIISTIFLFAIFTIKHFNNKIFLLFLLILTIGIRLFWINKIHTHNYSDFEIMYNAAVRAAKGDFGFTSEGEYFARWVYQLGYTMYQAFILHFIGGGTFTLKLFNIFYSTGTTLLIYLIARKLFNEPCGRIAGTLYALYIPSIAMSSVLTNQHLATFLFYLSFYLLISYFKSSKFIWIFIGIFFSIGDIIRPLGSLILLAVGIYVLVAHVINNTKQKRIASIGKFAGILLVFYFTHFLISSTLISAGVTQYSISNREPLWKFVTGLNPETTGVFSDDDAQYLAKFPLGDARDNASKALIKERLSDKSEVLTLFKDKFIYMWTKEDGSLIWGLRSKVYDYLDILQTLTKYERLMYLSMSFFILISTIKLLLDRKMEPHTTLFLLLIIGYMCVHLLIEIQTRYRYFIIPSFMIIQSYGIYTLYSFFKKLIPFRKITSTDKS